ncbi:E3 ubiquitin-protein ligase DTX3L isoform X6 [Gadus morhua]|uniref:E3 ubiquitin-protein ligase DTX3L isoform X6 n=1 Tax=Gadus morhua TaxID=8049 RepID=UPI0011B4A7A8|nr:E3 ubiquitin-protein ligase DTX3L-like isoform X6 [Gadus morhua]
MNTHSDQSTGSKTSSQDSETNAEAVPKGENNSDDQSTGSKTSSQDSEQPDAEEVANGRDNSNVMNTHSDQSTGSKTSSQDSETNAEEVPKGKNNSDDQSTGSKTSSQDSEQPDAEEVANGTPPKKDTTVATVHLKVVWPEGEPPPKWEKELQKALQSWFNKNPKNRVTTECSKLTGQMDGSVRLEITPATGQEDLFTDDTQLTLKDQTTASVRRLNGGGSARVHHYTHPSWLIPSAPPKNNSNDQSTGSKTSSQDSEQPDAEEVPNGTLKKKDKPVATVHLKVVWPEGEPPSRWETELQKALQSWFNKHQKSGVTTKCLNLTGQKDGSVRLELIPATGQEDLFTDDTQLTLRDQKTTASVRRLNGGGSAPVTHDNDTPRLLPSAPPTPMKKDKPVATIHLKVVWPEGEPPRRWETELQKALQSWFNKNPKRTVITECVRLTDQKDGSVRLEIIPATGQEDLFTDDTQLTLRDQKTTASVRRLNGGGSAPVTHDNDTPRLFPSAPPEPVSCTVPLVLFWYVNQVYREKMKRIEEKNGVHIQKEVKVSFNGDTSAGADPVKALSEFTDLVQSCLGDSTCYSYSHEPGQVDWEKALQLIQQGREKLTLTVSPHEVEVCGPMESLKTFQNYSKIIKKSHNSQIPGPSSTGEAQGRSDTLHIDPVHWLVITTLFKTELAELEKGFGVKYGYIQDKVKARAEMKSKDAFTLESDSLRALVCLHQRVTASVLSCSLQSQSQRHLVKERLAGLPGVVPDFRGDQWRIIGLPEDLRRAVDLIESDLGRPVFREEDKQRIGHLRYGVDSSGGSDMAGGKPPVRGAPAAEEEEDKCPVCMDQITNRRMLPCHHALCKECLENLVTQMGPTCPICKALFGELTGDQPDGRMTYETQRYSLPGFQGHGNIVIKYEMYPGKQTARHPNPGKTHYGTQRSAYLPDNREGREVLRLLQRAFDKRLIFTVGTSRTSGSEDQVTWNDIHHKTSISGGPSSFGYPDPDYLRRVKEELKAKGIE